MSEEPHVGSVHEEAVRLLGALGEWAGTQPGTSHDACADDAQLDADCRYCPVCQVIHVVRQTSPEVREHLTTAATALLRAAAELLATRPDGRGTHGTHASGGAVVERIDLDEGPPRPSE